MSEYFIEIYGEEIPSRSQISGEIFLSDFFSEHLAKKKISFKEMHIFSNSKRIGCSITEIPNISKGETQLVRGPSVGSKEKAVLGFMNSQKIKNRKLLKTKIVGEKEYFFFEKKVRSINNFNIFRELTVNLLNNFKWKTSMKWSNYSEKWIRPIKNIVCFFDEKKIDLSFCGIKSSDEVYCNVGYEKNKFKFQNFLNYKKTLERKFVYIDRKTRIKKIIGQIQNIEKKNKIKFNMDNDLLIECANFCENPVIFESRFDEKFFNMPKIFIQRILKEKQKYFSFYNSDGELSNIFAFIANNKKDPNLIIRNGHKKVLEARLKDTSFFINEDLLLKLSNRIELLRDITYFEGLGNLELKVNRLLSLSKFLCKEINFKLSPASEKIILISKSDLTTLMVKEFPSLQGKVGYYYAMKEGYKKSDCRAISEQYLPNNDDSSVPKSKFSICLALVEKIDHVVGAFLAKKKPSGSKDPFATRRATIGLIRILIENKLSIDIKKYIKLSLSLYKIDDNETKVEILNFIETRLSIYFKEMGYDTKIQNAVSVGCEYNPYIFIKKNTILSKKIKTKKFIDFLNSYKRLHSLILNKNIVSELPNENMFDSPEEVNLFKVICKFSDFIDTQDLNSSYQNSFNELIKISRHINDFLNNIIVNSDDIKIKNNRLTLISYCKLQLEKHTIFSEIL